jgi:hypothetical protein
MARPAAALIPLLCFPLLSTGLARAQASTRYNLTAVSASAPETAASGSSVMISATFQSMSDSPPPSFYWAAYLTTGGVLTGAIPIGRFGPVTLGQMDQETFNATAAVPAGVVGLFTVAVTADVDNTVAEYDELDNTAFAPTLLRVRARAPDLGVVSVTPEEARRRANETLHIDFVSSNTGEQPATVNVVGYISPHPAVSTVDSMIGTTTITVPAGGMIIGHISGVVPAGTPTGDYTVGVIADPNAHLSEVSTTNNYGVSTTKLNVYSDSLTFDTASLPDGALTVDYFVELSSTGGDGHFHYAVTTGSLPAGLTLAADSGIISGTPTEQGMAAFTLQATSGGLTQSRSFNVSIHATGAVLTIVTHTVLDGALALPYQQILVAAGGEPPYVWSIKDGQLPPGIMLDPMGILRGSPSTIGAFPFTLAVTDHIGATDSAEYTVNISPPVNVVVLLDQPPPVTIGMPIDFQLIATGGIGPYTWRLLSTPPPGVTLTDGGRLTGMPTQIGRFPMRVMATDSTPAKNGDTALVQVTVNDDNQLTIITGELPPVVVRTKWTARLQSTGGSSPLTWSIVPGDQLPNGFFLFQKDPSIPSDQAELRGTTVYPGLHAFTVRVEDAVGRRANKIMVIDILRPGTATSSGCVCAPGTTPVWSALLGGVALLFPVRRRLRRR